MSRHTNREHIRYVETPDVDLVLETWTPSKTEFEVYKRREIELACLRQKDLEGVPLTQWDRGLFSVHTWVCAL